jgi:hypothetical protein
VTVNPKTGETRDMSALVQTIAMLLAAFEPHEDGTIARRRGESDCHVSDARKALRGAPEGQARSLLMEFAARLGEANLAYARNPSTYARIRRDLNELGARVRALPTSA